MSDTGAGVQWVDTAEEEVVVVVTEDDTAAVLPVLEPSAAAAPIQKLLETAVADGGVAEAEGNFYCEECQALFQDQNQGQSQVQDVDSTNITGPSFVLDFPTGLGVPQRALLSLPYGLTVGRSSIPGAGVGVLNHGPTVSPGMHFGPCEGELSTLEQAVASDFSWEICRGQDDYEYLDAATESHSNWMRYVNFARNKAEMNLLAVQYKGSILFHCCRSIGPGDELLVWPSRQLLQLFSATWAQVWLMRLNARESGCSSGAAPVFLCPCCQLTFTTEAFLQRHAHTFHSQPAGDGGGGDGGGGSKEEAEAAEASAVTLDDSAAPQQQQQQTALPADPQESNTCSDCGKMFKQLPHLRRHQLCVHSNQRPYCCPQCRRSFSQASGLVRHQRVHRRRARAGPGGQEENCGSAPSEEARGADGSDAAPSRVGSDCGGSSTGDASLREHRAAVHQAASDLSEQLQHHPSPGGGASTPAFGCECCSLAFPSVDELQRHAEEHQSQSEQTKPADHHDDGVSAGSDPSLGPQNPVEPTQTPGPQRRPQRLRAKSNVSAITKLIAPKRRAAAAAKRSPSHSGSAHPDSGSAHPDSKPSEWFSCNRCQWASSDPDELKNHSCSPQRRHQCSQCRAAFLKSGALKRHQQAAHSSSAAKSYSCERCRKSFSTPNNLRQHRRSNSCVRYHCTSELFSCPHCQFSFNLKSYLLKHLKRHHPVEYLAHCESGGPAEQLQDRDQDQEPQQQEQKYECPHCALRCVSAKEFKSHSCFQQVKVLYLCTDCGKGFANHYGLKQHQRVHTGEKPYTCPHCAKGFSYTGQLTVHLRTHTGEKPYLCTHCGESFRQSGDLKRHERKHTGVRPHSCPECCRSFSRPQSLRAHQLLHQGQKMFKCTQCGKSFSRSYHLRRHQQKVHL